MNRFVMFVFFAAFAAASDFAQTVSVSLNSPQDGNTVSPGSTVNWSISFVVSTGDNDGLALLAVDLVQSASNPDLFDLPYAVGVPSGMANFSRPAGISNPGEGGNTTGYVGVQRGPTGAKNLIQLGGGQNTFGIAPVPASGVGQSVNVVGGVGQSGAQLLASGSFSAPSDAGTYTFSLANAVANVLVDVIPAPGFSPVIGASVDVTDGTISFTVGSGGVPGDMNCDGIVTPGDIAGFVLALTNPAQYMAQFPNCNINNADVNNDGVVSPGDIAPFVAILTGG